MRWRLNLYESAREYILFGLIYYIKIYMNLIGFAANVVCTLSVALGLLLVCRGRTGCKSGCVDGAMLRIGAEKERGCVKTFRFDTAPFQVCQN